MREIVDPFQSQAPKALGIAIGKRIHLMDFIGK
jgi:hypothetical protein